MIDDGGGRIELDRSKIVVEGELIGSEGEGEEREKKREKKRKKRKKMKREREKKRKIARVFKTRIYTLLEFSK